MREFRDAHIRTTSQSAGAISQLITGHFDIVIAASSWDRRSTAITASSSLSAGKSLLLVFCDRDPFGLRDAHDKDMRSFLGGVSKQIVEIEADSCNVHETWNNVRACILEHFDSVQRPISMLVDLTCVPRYYSLGILGSLIPAGVVGSVSYYYTEGIYPEETHEGDRHEMFTEGGWNAVAIPGLEGEWEADKAWLYLVSVGFEGSKTLRLVSRAEPDQLAVLFPDPPVHKGYVERAWDHNKVLFERFDIPASRIIRAPASDAVTAWKTIRDTWRDDSEDTNTVLVCCGTKPHSLALALLASIHRKIAVHYIVPDRHRVVNVIPNGTFWRYDVQDITIPNVQRGPKR